jgi:hypothetical protein
VQRSIHLLTPVCATLQIASLSLTATNYRINAPTHQQTNASRAWKVRANGGSSTADGTTTSTDCSAAVTGQYGSDQHPHGAHLGYGSGSADQQAHNAAAQQFSRARAAAPRRPGVLDRLLGRTARQIHCNPAEITGDEAEGGASSGLVTAVIDEV